MQDKAQAVPLVRMRAQLLPTTPTAHLPRWVLAQEEQQPPVTPVSNVARQAIGHATALVSAFPLMYPGLQQHKGLPHKHCNPTVKSLQ